MANPGRGKNGKFIKTLAVAERDAQAAYLRDQGLSLAEIALRLGYATESGAARAIDRAIKAVPMPGVEEIRARALARLDRATAIVLKAMEGEYFLVAASGRVAVHPDTGEPLRDPGPRLAAIDRLVRLEERRARLTGADAPRMTVSDIRASAQINEEIKVLLVELGVKREPPALQ